MTKMGYVGNHSVYWNTACMWYWNVTFTLMFWLLRWWFDFLLTHGLKFHPDLWYKFRNMFNPNPSTPHRRPPPSSTSSFTPPCPSLRCWQAIFRKYFHIPMAPLCLSVSIIDIFYIIGFRVGDESFAYNGLITDVIMKAQSWALEEWGPRD